MERSEITRELKRRAEELGFPLVGICAAVSPPGAARLDEWLTRGYAGEMHYIAERRQAYSHPEHVLAGVRSLVMLGMPYRTEEPAPPAAGDGRVARYAWGGQDYHDVIRKRLHALADYLKELSPEATTRCVVDTAPLLEREFARLAGLGWVGKHTLLLNRDAGSYFFLASLLTDLALDYDAPFEADHCGTCTACLDSCPTQAFPQPYVLDASRCISYLTIELRGSTPLELRPAIGEWVFGCDVCMEVCPWERFSSATADSSLAPAPGMNRLELAELFELSEAEFRRRFRKTPLWRPHRRGLLRNAAIVLGNQQDDAATPALARGLNDAEPLVRGTCAWALGRIGTRAAHGVLLERQAVETDSDVQREIEVALAAVDAEPGGPRMVDSSLASR